MVAPVLRNSGSALPELTPVCCHCQRERFAHGEWREHIPVAGERLTHGICPQCLDTLYPDLAPLIRAAS